MGLLTGGGLMIIISWARSGCGAVNSVNRALGRGGSPPWALLMAYLSCARVARGGLEREYVLEEERAVVGC